MSKGLRGFHHTGDWHFITCSCYRRQKFVDWVRRRDLFLDILEQVRAKYDFVVAGYVDIHPAARKPHASGTPVMPEHFQLVNRGTARGQALAGHAGVEAARLAGLPREEEKEGPSDSHRPQPSTPRSSNLFDTLSVGVDRIQRNFEPMQRQVESWRQTQITDARAKFHGPLTPHSQGECSIHQASSRIVITRTTE